MWDTAGEVETSSLMMFSYRPPSHGRANAGQPAQTYIQQLCEDMGCSPEDLPEAMNDWEEWRERVGNIRAGGMTRWWWWERERERERESLFFFLAFIMDTDNYWPTIRLGSDHLVSWFSCKLDCCVSHITAPVLYFQRLTWFSFLIYLVLCC